MTALGVIGTVALLAALHADSEDAEELKASLSGEQIVTLVSLSIFLATCVVIMALRLAVWKYQARTTINGNSQSHAELQAIQIAVKRKTREAREEMGREFEEWKLIETSRIYEKIIDQQRRGVLRQDGDRCPSCRGRDDLAS